MYGVQILHGVVLDEDGNAYEDGTGRPGARTYTAKLLVMMRKRLAPKDLTAWSVKLQEHSRFRC